MCDNYFRPRRLCEDGVSSFLDAFDVFLFDCDGVLWLGEGLIEGVPETLAHLRSLGKKVLFVTNNSTKSRAAYKAKFDRLGLGDDVGIGDIYSSSFAAAAYFSANPDFRSGGKKVYVLGEEGICDELDLAGIPWVGGPEHAGRDLEGSTHDPDVGAVIVGYDRHINYYKIQWAQACLNRNEGCEFVATNLDATTPGKGGEILAAGGSMVGAIKGCTGQEPTVVGKPSPWIVDDIVSKLHGSSRNRICMVGDRLDTDILFGAENGLHTLLVLCGVTSEDMMHAQKDKITPDWFTDSISEFLPRQGGSKTQTLFT
mmetsp:Transcript_58910/g.175249  ORF Transcript_58910/g.175249 Transcript_58910/m.175249 type:complete len:313 (-) Transcript_58910:61-999(-)|eukprot:CAMPEP_0113559462 /NCGR_PEP_ID=MMETSP0015_2-20120614/18910_1 /TAXON_ID=2838 /ORGANISM="Odontella" /LENGTH=312 /DNA_ID=CAMNT_0000461101 /DNA_START=129 /DNA_END=1067 /DNA_ORIENTATION=- /assembly_acc=CAM_ASM_000160